MANKTMKLGLFTSEDKALQAIENNRKSLGTTDKKFEYFHTKITRNKETQKVWKAWRVRR